MPENRDLGVDYTQSRANAEAELAAEELLAGTGVFAETSEAPKPTAPKEKEGSLIGGGPVEFGKQILGGAADAFREANEALDSATQFIEKQTGLKRGGLFENLAKATPEVEQPKGAGTQLARSAAQFLTAFIPGLQAGKVMGIKGAIKLPAFAGAVADITAFDPDDPNVSNLINDLAPALKNPLTEFLETEPGDSEALNRFKRAIEGTGLGLAADGIFRIGRAMRASKGVKGTTEKITGAKPAEELTSKAAEVKPGAATAKPVSKVEVRQASTKKGAEFLAADPSTIQVGDKAIKVKWDQIGDPQDIDDVIKTLTKLNESKIDVARRGVQSMDKTRELAEMLDLSVDDILQRRTGEALNSEQTQAFIDLWGASIRQLKTLRDDPRVLTDPAVEAEFRNQLGVTGAITEQIFGARAEAGRALRIWGETAQPVSTEAKQLQSGIEIAVAGRSYGDVPIEKLVQIAKTIETPGQHSAFFRTASKVPNALVEAWINGLLSNPTTHVVNATSNTTVAMFGLAERTIASGARKLASKIGLAEEVNGVVHGETTAMIGGAVEGFMDGLRAAGKALRTGRSEGFSKIDIPRRAISAENFNVSGPFGKAVDLLGEAVRLPGRFLVAADDFFKGINYRMELRAQAWREAVKEGLDTPQAIARYRQILTDPPASIKQVADQFAHYQTFTNQLGETGQAVLKFANSHPLARVIIPFVRTPTNIFKYTLERTPIANMLLRQVRQDIAAGGVRRDLALAKTAMGGMVTSVAAYLSANGSITGSGPRNQSLRNIKRQTGWQPNSIRVGNTWYSYNRLDPIGALLGVTANFNEIAGELDRTTAESLGMAIAMSFKDAFLDKTYLEGLSNVVEAINTPDRAAQTYMERLGRSLIPAGLAQLTRNIDPTLKEVNGVMDAIKARIPGNDLPPRRNLWGEPIVLEGGLGPDLITPFYSSTRKDDPVAEEMVRLDLGISMPPDFIGGTRPSRSPLARERVGQGIFLTPEEYDRFVVLAGNELKIRGLGMRENLELTIQSDDYLKQSADGKAFVIRSVVHQYREAAKLQLRKEFPVLDEAIKGIQLEKAEALRPTGEIGITP